MWPKVNACVCVCPWCPPIGMAACPGQAHMLRRFTLTTSHFSILTLQLASSPSCCIYHAVLHPVHHSALLLGIGVYSCTRKPGHADGVVVVLPVCVEQRDACGSCAPSCCAHTYLHACMNAACGLHRHCHSDWCQAAQPQHTAADTPGRQPHAGGGHRRGEGSGGG